MVALVGAGAAAGVVVERYAYAPFGAVAVLDAAGAPKASSPYGQRRLFQGGRRDAATGLYLFGFRDLDPASGTWMQRDPIGLAGMDPNLYRFVGGNPVNHSDPSGLADWDFLKWMWTGDGFAPDAVLAAAMDAGGGNLLANSQTVEAAAEYTAMIDPTAASGVMRAGMQVIQARDADAAATLAQTAADMAGGKLFDKGLGAAKRALPGGTRRGVPGTPGHGLSDPTGGLNFAKKTDECIVDAWKAKISGRAQKTGTPGHRFRTYREAIAEAKKPEVLSVHLDHGYNRALDLDPRTIVPNRRPDVVSVYKDGKVVRIETKSNWDRIPKLIKRNEYLDEQLRGQGLTPLPPRVVLPTAKKP